MPNDESLKSSMGLQRNVKDLKIKSDRSNFIIDESNQFAIGEMIRFTGLDSCTQDKNIFI